MDINKIIKKIFLEHFNIDVDNKFSNKINFITKEILLSATEIVYLIFLLSDAFNVEKEKIYIIVDSKLTFENIKNIIEEAL